MESLLPKDHTRYNPSRLPGSALEAINVEDEESKRREEAFGSDQPLPPEPSHCLTLHRRETSQGMAAKRMRLA